MCNTPSSSTLGGNEKLSFSNESYGNKLFGISGAQATRITPRAQLPFFENINSLFQICRLNGATRESQLELETGSSESSPPSHAESPARLLPDSVASTPDIFMMQHQDWYCEAL
jgi:hypothetical protein